MKTLEIKTAVKHIIGTSITIVIILFALSNRFCLADTCPPNMQPTLMNEELLAHAYQPPDGDILHRYRFLPPWAGPNNQLPTVLMLPPDIFYKQYDDLGVPSERGATYDLQQAGFLVFQIEHRLAPGDGFLPGQDYQHGSLGRPPDQTDDVKRQILAALADPQCNGSIYLVGGSAGGCLALWVMLDPATGLVTGWDDTVRQKIKAVVSLSGVTKLCDWNNPGGITQDVLIRFEMDLDNYVGLPQNPPDQDCSYLDPASPYTIVSTATSSPPVLLYATQKDPVPYEQANVMFTALVNAFGNTPVRFTKYVLSDTTGLHAFNYWHTQNTISTPQDCVSHQVITFLQANP